MSRPVYTGGRAIRAFVTGAAGFIGSHLCEALVSEGHHVRGIDSFTSAYDPELKRRHIRDLLRDPRFELVEKDLRSADLRDLVSDVDVIYHLAAIPGVRASWSDEFRGYVEANVLATQRLLEAARHGGVHRFVYASSSSVYGNADRYPVHEDDLKRPHSPYGVTKLAAEHLCDTYWDVFKLPTVSLRYFSVYGPRQRPDMGIHRIIEAALGRGTFTVFGDGTHVRDMTYVADVVAATIAAATVDVESGTPMNIAGGSEFTVNQVLEIVGDIVGHEVPPRYGPEQAGDVRRTGGSTDRARELLDWKPSVELRAGLERQVEWHRSLDAPDLDRSPVP